MLISFASVLDLSGRTSPYVPPPRRTPRPQDPDLEWNALPEHVRAAVIAERRAWLRQEGMGDLLGAAQESTVPTTEEQHARSGIGAALLRRIPRSTGVLLGSAVVFVSATFAVAIGYLSARAGDTTTVLMWLGLASFLVSGLVFLAISLEARRQDKQIEENKDLVLALLRTQRDHRFEEQDRVHSYEQSVQGSRERDGARHD